MVKAMFAVKFVPNKFGRVRLELNGYQYMVKNKRRQTLLEMHSPVMSNYS